MGDQSSFFFFLEQSQATNIWLIDTVKCLTLKHELLCYRGAFRRNSKMLLPIQSPLRGFSRGSCYVDTHCGVICHALGSCVGLSGTIYARQVWVGPGQLTWRQMEHKRRAEREAEVTLVASLNWERAPLTRAALGTVSPLHQYVMLWDAGKKTPHSCSNKYMFVPLQNPEVNKPKAGAAAQWSQQEHWLLLDCFATLRGSQKGSELSQKPFSANSCLCLIGQNCASWPSLCEEEAGRQH